ncbi:MAG: CinA family protein [Burkholderiales bacterium]|nr:CinA family protein [Burkholderiales bacterium]
MNEPELVTLAARVGHALLRREVMVATAESCTGGWIAATLTAVAGSSQWVERGYVTYSNAAKESLLGVPGALIAVHGAVSEPVARAMAEGALARSRAHLALSVTGVAGPGGGSVAKPVGMVCFGWAAAGEATRVETRLLAGDRDQVRRAAVIHALEGLLASLGESG